MRQKIVTQLVRKTKLLVISISLLTILGPALMPIVHAWNNPAQPEALYGPCDDDFHYVSPAYYDTKYWYGAHSNETNDDPPTYYPYWYNINWGDGTSTGWIGPYSDNPEWPPEEAMPVEDHTYNAPGWKTVTIYVHDQYWYQNQNTTYVRMLKGPPYHTVTFEAYDQNSDPVTDPYNQPPAQAFFVTCINWGEWYGYTFQTFGDVYEWDHSFETANDIWWWNPYTQLYVYYSLDHMEVDGNPYTMGNGVSVTSDVSVVCYYYAEFWGQKQVSALTELGYTQNEIIELAKMGHLLGYTPQTIVELVETCLSLGYAPEGIMGHSLGYTPQTIVEFAETCCSLGYAPEWISTLM